MKVAFISADWGQGDRGLSLGGSGWARVGVIAHALAARGHDVAVAPQLGVFPDGSIVGATSDGAPMLPPAPVVVLQRWMLDQAEQVIRGARAAGQTVVQDVDDWFWGLDPANAAHAATDPTRNAEVNRVHYARAVAASDVVTVSTDYLARRIRERMGVRTVVLRNVVPHRFTPAPVRPAAEGLRIGWVGALGWRSGDLEVLDGVLEAFLASTGSTFVHHGAMPRLDTDTAAGRLGLSSATTGPARIAVPPARYPELLSGFDVGIVPLADVPFNRAKSWIKGLEYAAAGIPFVASRTREYEQLGCGLLARTRSQWRAQLERLTDPAVRLEQQHLGFRVAARHAVEERVQEWEALYASLSPNGGR